SRLYRRVAGLDTPTMPMGGDSLEATEIAAIKAWIDQGADWPAATIDAPSKPNAAALAALETRTITPEERSYWAFKLPVKPTLPSIDARPSNPIDRFLEQARRAHGLTAAPRADPNTLVRRAYLDLLGLPPTPEQTAAFVADPSPAAWERLVDAL